MHTAQSLNNKDVATIERVGRLAMALIADVVVAMVLIADVLALLAMIEQPERKTTTAMAMEK